MLLLLERVGGGVAASDERDGGRAELKGLPRPLGARDELASALDRGAGGGLARRDEVFEAWRSRLDQNLEPRGAGAVGELEEGAGLLGAAGADPAADDERRR